MTPSFSVRLVDDGPNVLKWNVIDDDVEILRVEVERKTAAVGVTLIPLPQSDPAKNVAWEDRPEAHDAFYAARDHYDWLSGNDDKSFPRISTDDWSKIEDALDGMRALDLPAAST